MCEESAKLNLGGGRSNAAAVGQLLHACAESLGGADGRSYGGKLIECSRGAADKAGAATEESTLTLDRYKDIVLRL